MERVGLASWVGFGKGGSWGSINRTCLTPHSLVVLVLRPNLPPKRSNSSYVAASRTCSVRGPPREEISERRDRKRTVVGTQHLSSSGSKETPAC